MLGEPPRDRSLAVRAHLGRARVAMARAEYRKLEGADPSVLLKIAEASLAEALRLDETEPGVALGYADFYRVQGSRQRANKFLAKVEAAGVDSDEANLVRAAVSVHNGDWAAAQSRLARLPAWLHRGCGVGLDDLLRRIQPQPELHEAHDDQHRHQGK